MEIPDAIRLVAEGDAGTSGGNRGVGIGVGVLVEGVGKVGDAGVLVPAKTW
jgi:hypothetical protein